MVTPDTPEPDAIARFAADLRRLRHESGDPTIVALASGASISKSVVGDAFGGHRLPTEKTVRALVARLGVDAEPWVERRSTLAGVVPRTTREGVATPSAGETAGAGRAPRVVALRSAVALIVLAFLVGAGVTAGVVRAASPGPAVAAGAPTVRARPTSVASLPAEGSIATVSGDDPAKTPCVDDAKPVESQIRARGTKLEIIFSAGCDAAWSRITRTDNAGYGQSVTTTIYEEADPQAPDRQTTTEKDVDSAYTTLIVRPTPDTRICATGSITVKGASVSLGAPLCL